MVFRSKNYVTQRKQSKFRERLNSDFKVPSCDKHLVNLIIL